MKKTIKSAFFQKFTKIKLKKKENTNKMNKYLPAGEAAEDAGAGAPSGMANNRKSNLAGLQMEGTESDLNNIYLDIADGIPGND